VFAANPEKANDPGALENAAIEGHEAFVQLMLRYQPNLPQRIAVGVKSRGLNGPVKTRTITELLFSHGMSPSLPDWLCITPMHRFAERGDVENAVVFIEHGADVNALDEELCSTPLGWAAKYGKLAMAELLLKHGAKKDIPADRPWATPVAWAARRGHSEF